MWIGMVHEKHKQTYNTKLIRNTAGTGTNKNIIQQEADHHDYSISPDVANHVRNALVLKIQI